MTCSTCGNQMVYRTHALGPYATLTIRTCEVCLTTPEPDQLASTDVFEYRAKVDDLMRGQNTSGSANTRG